MKLIITIIDRNLTDRINHVFLEHRIIPEFISYGTGTANSEILEYFGLGSTDKEVIFIFADDEEVEKIFRFLSDIPDFLKKGGGVAFTISVSSIGKKALDYLHLDHSKEDYHGQ